MLQLDILKFCELYLARSIVEQTEQLNFNHFIESRMCGINSSVSTQHTHIYRLHNKQKHYLMINKMVIGYNKLMDIIKIF